MEKTAVAEAKEAKLTPAAISKQFNDLVRLRFVHKLTQLLEKAHTEDNLVLNNIWMFNQVLIPLCSASNATVTCGNIKIRYGTPENESAAYASLSSRHRIFPFSFLKPILINCLHLVNKSHAAHSLQVLNELQSKQDENIDDSNFSLDIESFTEAPETDTTSSKPRILHKTYVHTCFASNHLGK